jgi:hypothetical protein
MKKEHRFFDNFLIVTFMMCLFMPLVFTDHRVESMIERLKLVPYLP